MSFTPAPITIEPESQDMESLVAWYKEQESHFPVAPVKKQKLLKAAMMTWFVASSLPALILWILRIPFILVRKLRVRMLKSLGERQFKANYGWDPDHALREYCFIEPAYKELPETEAWHKSEREYREQLAKWKQDWQNDPENLDLLMDYTIHESYTNYYHEGTRRTLYILHQLKSRIPHEKLNESILYWNLSVVLEKLELTNQARHFGNLSIEKGYKPLKPGGMKLFFISPLLTEAWSSLRRAMINSWPSLN